MDDVVDKIYDYEHPLQHDDEVLQARVYMNQAGEIKRMANKVLNKVSARYEHLVGTTVHQHKKPFEVIMVKADQHGAIKLQVFPLKKDGTRCSRRYSQSINSTSTDEAIKKIRESRKK